MIWRKLVPILVGRRWILAYFAIVLPIAPTVCISPSSGKGRGLIFVTIIVFIPWRTCRKTDRRGTLLSDQNHGGCGEAEAEQKPCDPAAPGADIHAR
jgi:hypothetical protein